MDIKAGDKVRFLNSVGGGIVSRLKGKGQVLVEDEDGFEIPALIHELVVVENLDKQTFTSRLKPAPPVETPKPDPKPEVRVIKETPDGERLNACLAYLPIDPKAMQQTGYEAFFVNDSNYYLFFNYATRLNNSWISRYNGVVDPNTKIFIEEFEKDSLNDMERICVQLIAFKKDKPYLPKDAHSIELRIDTVKFYKLHCFTENDYFEEDALIFPIVREDAPERQSVISATELRDALMQKSDSDKPARRPSKHKPQNEVVEVDLHIAHLLDNTNGLSPSDMLNYQLDKFHEVLAGYAGRKGQKIVFIHGKGNGVLRTSIEKELHRRYPSYTYQDASFREYGFGATLVTVK
ncbi:MAG: DUF2027 domain-containing protein [Tannerellaceae bacterium]|jgi:hypothetical protein|nr:DUF2027 domain-containing protein [Tannerellaceae bacterium]